VTVKEEDFGEVIAEARIVKRKTAEPAPAAPPAEITPEVVEAAIEPVAEIPPEAEAPEGIETPVEEPRAPSDPSMGNPLEDRMGTPPPKPKPLVRFL
jgi:hypothetical protein